MFDPSSLVDKAKSTFNSTRKTISSSTDTLNKFLANPGDAISTKLSKLSAETGTPITSVAQVSTRFGQCNPNALMWPNDALAAPYIEIHVIVRGDSTAMKKSSQAVDSPEVASKINSGISGLLGTSYEAGVKRQNEQAVKTESDSQAPTITETDEKNTTQNALDKEYEKVVSYDQSRFRLAQSIILPLPASITVPSTVNWNTDAQLGAEGALLFDPAVADSVSSLGENTWKEIGKTVATGAGRWAASKVISSDVTNKTTNMINNPMSSVLFNGTALRKFDFAWTMSARNQNEAYAINNIVRSLRYYASPEFTGAFRTFMKYPSEFEIMFKIGSKEIDSLPQIKRCVCSSINVTYGAGSKYSYLVDDVTGNLATSVTLNLQFAETLAITKEDIGDPLTSGRGY